MSLRRAALEIVATVMLGLVTGSAFAALLWGSGAFARFVGHLVDILRFQLAA